MDPITMLVDEMFGEAVDPREVKDLISKSSAAVAKQNDASELHIPAGLQAKKRQKRQAQIGLASNIVGLTAGAAATVAAAKNPALRKPLMENAGPVTRRAGQYLKTDAGRARLYRAGAGGALGLQVVNTGGDVVANRVLDREAKKKIEKAMTAVVKVWRAGKITSDQAIDVGVTLAEMVQKNHPLDANKIFDAVDEISPMVPSKKLQLATTGVRTTNKTRKKLVAVAKKPKIEPGSTPAVQVAKNVTWAGTIAKRNDEKQQVFGFCTVTAVDGKPLVDRQGDYIPLEEIEKSAYTYVVESRLGGDQHERAGVSGEVPLHTSDMIESFVITPEKLQRMGLAPDALPHGWWVGFQVNDPEQWEKVKNNERTGFSIHGSGKRVEKVMA